MAMNTTGTCAELIGVDKFQGNVVQLRPAGDLFGGPPQLCVVGKPVFAVHAGVAGQTDVEAAGVAGGACCVRHEIIRVAQNEVAATAGEHVIA